MKTLLLGAAIAFLATACNERQVAPPTEVQAVLREAVPGDPGDTAWSAAPVYTAALIPQDMVEPRQLAATTAEAQVRAICDGGRIAFLLTWRDATRDDLPQASHFCDACAVQLPARIEASVPDPQMGDPQRAVEVAYWRASWQASVDGRPDTIQSLYPGAAVDHYPFQAPSLETGSTEQVRMAERYAPARRLGNAMEGPRQSPVEDLVASGPGTLERAPQQRSSGCGRRTAEGWEVVIVRPLPEGLRPGGTGQLALAIWDGAQDEVGSRKMRTVWIPIRLEEVAR